MTATNQLWFSQALKADVRQVQLPDPAKGQVRVRTRLSAVSAGTELLVYRGQVPEEMSLDASLETLAGSAQFPLQYGYACVGEVESLGSDVDLAWQGKRVFAFAPHAGHFNITPDSLVVLPESLSFEDAVFLANMETAVNLAQDACPLLGERVVVLGLGVVGQLLCAVLAGFPVATLIGVDGVARRRELALMLGAGQVADVHDCTLSALGLSAEGADLIVEVSGVPEALNTAIELSGYGSRILVGSWYGSKSAAVALGGKAHRNRLNIRTSQVSTIAPELSARWNKSRRMAQVLRLLGELQPSRLITDRVRITDAPYLYERLHRGEPEIVQAVFDYD